MIVRFSLKAMALFIVVLFIFSCATTMDAKITYLTARDSFNAALRNYSERVKVMPEAEKAAVKAEFNPIWKDAAIALDGWGGAVTGATTDDPALSVREFTAAKNALIRLGLKYFGDSLFGEPEVPKTE
jgi:hypothetical protein